jgi:hypothetical protein
LQRIGVFSGFFGTDDAVDADAAVEVDVDGLSASGAPFEVVGASKSSLTTKSSPPSNPPPSKKSAAEIKMLFPVVLLRRKF